MALTKVSGFTGEAEVRGQLRGVQFNNGALSIYGLALDEAYEILETLSAKRIEAVRVRGKEVGPVPPTPTPQPAAPAHIATEAPSAQAPKKEHAPASKDVLVPPAPDQLKALEEKIQKSADPSGVPEEIKSAKRFITVLEWVMKASGHKDVAGLLPEMEKLREAVPVVRRVSDLKDKIESNLAAFAEAGDAGS